MNEPFKLGDWVVLNSGGPACRVVDIGPTWLVASWLSAVDGQPREVSTPPGCWRPAFPSERPA